MNEKDVDKIVIHFTDGSTKEINKGFLANMVEHEENGTCEITFDMVHVAGKDLATIVSAVTEFGFKAGMFSDDENEVDDE